MKIYFAGSIRGGRDDKKLYADIIQLLSQHGQVLTEHVGDLALSERGDDGPNDTSIYDRDMGWLDEADVVIAEVTSPSLGVGYEVAKAEDMDKDILCLFRKNSSRYLSAMIAGSQKITLAEYQSLDDIRKALASFLKTSQSSSSHTHMRKRTKRVSKRTTKAKSTRRKTTRRRAAKKTTRRKAIRHKRARPPRARR